MELRESSESCLEQEKEVTLNTVPVSTESEKEEITNTAETVAEVIEEPTAETVSYAGLSKNELVAKLTELIAEEAIDKIRNSVAQIKQLYYSIRKSEIEKEKTEFVEKGNQEEAFSPADEPTEATFKSLLEEYRAKRTEYIAAIEQQRKDVLAQKLDIIEKMQAIIADTDNINKHYTEFQQLQQEFKTAGEVPAESVTDLWKKYQLTTENFYDLLKINKDLRDYDFKKNLELKQAICENAEALANENDIISSFKQLQEYHNQWREIGPVAKEIREELWNRFKDASSIINKRYQAHYEERRGKEKENEEAKTILCEKLEAIDLEIITTYVAWDEATKTIRSYQEEWKTLGFASRKANNELFARFRKSCDYFFAKKTEFFKGMKEELSTNLQKKIHLCEKAETLKDSTEWKKTTDELIALQKEWKTVGPVIKKHSEQVWKRFISACDEFFEKKGQATKSVKQTESTNLKAKKSIIEKLKAIVSEAEETTDDIKATIKSQISEWQKIGHVPFKEKDKIYAEYQAIIKEAYDKFDLKETRAYLSNFESNLESIAATGKDKLYRERDKAIRFVEQKRNELKTYQNNLGFFNAKSKSGNSMLKEMERKMEKIQEEIKVLEEKVKMIDSKM